MSLPILYSFRRCPYAIRARFSLVVLNTSVYLREVVLKDKPEALLSLGGRSTVPQMLLSDGTRLEESLDIIMYALSQNSGEFAQALWPMNKRERTKIMTWIRYNDVKFKFWLDRYKYSDRYEHSEEFYRSKAEVFLRRMESRLEKRDYLLSEHSPTLADICIFPFIRQLSGVNASWFASSPYPNVRRWLGVFLEGENFAKTMKKFDKWQPDQEPIVFPVQ